MIANNNNTMNNTDIIKGVIESINNSTIGFAFEMNDENGNTIIKQFDSQTNALNELSRIITMKPFNKNPNQTDIIVVFNKTIFNENTQQQTFVMFAAQSNDYSSNDEFLNDAKNAINLLANLNNLNNKTINFHPIIIIPSEFNSIIGDNNLCSVDITQMNIEEAISIIANYTTSSTDKCPSLSTTTTTTTTMTPSNPPQINSSSSSSISSSTSTSTPSQTPSTTSTPSQTPSTTSTPSQTPSTTSTPSQTPSTTSTPSQTPFTPSSTPSGTGIITPPCFGDFIFVLDGSTGKYNQNLTFALKNITNNWKLDGTNALRLTGIVSASNIGDFSDPKPFEKTPEKWDNLINRLQTAMRFFPAKPISPKNISDGLTKIYCDKPSNHSVQDNGNVTFIIFTSWSNDSGIDEALRNKPWIKCLMAKKLSVFMIAFDGGSQNLKQLGIPSEEFFIDMGDFKNVSMHHLAYEVVLNTCDCNKKNDGSIPEGCRETTEPPTPSQTTSTSTSTSTSTTSTSTSTVAPTPSQTTSTSTSTSTPTASTSTSTKPTASSQTVSSSTSTSTATIPTSTPTKQSAPSQTASSSMNTSISGRSTSTPTKTPVTTPSNKSIHVLFPWDAPNQPPKSHL